MIRGGGTPLPESVFQLEIADALIQKSLKDPSDQTKSGLEHEQVKFCGKSCGFSLLYFKRLREVKKGVLPQLVILLETSIAQPLSARLNFWLCRLPAMLWYSDLSLGHQNKSSTISPYGHWLWWWWWIMMMMMNYNVLWWDPAVSPPKLECGVVLNMGVLPRWQMWPALCPCFCKGLRSRG